MKILLIGFTKLKYMPYANFYLQNIDKKTNDVHFLYWNRDLLDEETSIHENVTMHEFRSYQEDDVNKISKIKNFIRYKRYTVDVINNLKPDFIYILHTFPGVLNYRLLKKKFSNRYIFDYRDSTYEMFPPFKIVIQRLVRHSHITFVSSDGFRKYMPKNESNKIITSHNILLDSIKHRDEGAKEQSFNRVIRIAFWGIIRNEELNIRIISCISKDRRFELHYYGREQQIALNLKAYVNRNEIRNVFFHGEYIPEDRYVFAANTDLIHNIYCDSNMMLAMSNKYYDGIVFRIPQICMPNSYMGRLVTENCVGTTVDPYDPYFTDKLYEYLKGLDRENFCMSCDKALSQVLKEYEYGCKIISGQEV